MYVVSCRRGFTSPQFVGAATRYRNYTHPANVDVFTDINLTQIKDAAANQHVCILVHGYNTDTSEAMPAYWEIVTRMNDTGVVGPDGYGLVIGFLWPAFTTMPSYFLAVPNAEESAAFLLELINNLRGSALSVDVQTHSLGARVALTALADPSSVFVDNLLLSAPAVDDHLLEPDEAFFPSMNGCNRCFVFHSKKDKVLSTGYWVGDVTDGIHGALGRKGPRSKAITLAKTKGVYVVDCTAPVGKNHSGYRKTDRYFKYWKKTLTGEPLERYCELP
jgi:esterase/lipase superfamily enzyme